MKYSILSILAIVLLMAMLPDTFARKSGFALKKFASRLRNRLALKA